MIIAGGLTTLKPIGGIVSNNPSLTNDQAEKAAEDRAAQHQAKLDQFINKVVDNQKGTDNKRWSVPFK